MSSFMPLTPEELTIPWPQDYDHFSASSMLMFRRCPEQWRRVYCLGERRRPNAARIWGNADQATITRHWDKQIEDGVGLNEVEVQDAFADAYRDAIANDGGLDEVEWVRGERVSTVAARKISAGQKDQGTRLIAAYHRQIAPSVSPAAVEVKFSIEHSSWPKPLIGFIDCETTDGKLIERKTVSRRENKAKPDSVYQSRMYQVAQPKPVEIHHSVRTKEPQVYTFDPIMPDGIETAIRQVAMTFRQIGHLLTDYGPEEPWPDGTTHEWACNYCGFRPTCRWWT